MAVSAALPVVAGAIGWRDFRRAGTGGPATAVTTGGWQVTLGACAMLESVFAPEQ